MLRAATKSMWGRCDAHRGTGGAPQSSTSKLTPTNQGRALRASSAPGTQGKRKRTRNSDSGMKLQDSSPNRTVSTLNVNGPNTPTERQRFAELITKTSSYKTWSVRNLLQMQQGKRVKGEERTGCPVVCRDKETIRRDYVLISDKVNFRARKITRNETMLNMNAPNSRAPST